MRIALVATHHAEYAANLALALSAHHEVLLVLSRRNAARQLRAESFDRLREALTLRIVPHHYAPLQPLVAALCLRHVAAFAPDVVHAQEHPTRSTWWLAHALGGRLPFVLTVHDPKAHSGGDARAAAGFARYNGRLRADADALIVHGRALIEDLGADAVRAHLVAHGALRFGLLGDATALGPRTSNRLILFGRMERYKGLDLLLDANARWLAEGLDIELVVAGAGREIARLRDRLAAAPNILLYGERLAQARLAALVGGAAAAILPYRDATQSGVAASAFGVGTPVVASDVGALGEVVRDGDNGLLVPPGDVAALAAAGRRIVEDAALRARLAAGAARTAAGELGWASVAARTEAAYRAAAAAHRAR